MRSGNVHFRLKFDPIIRDIKLVAFGGEIWLGKNPEEGETSNHSRLVQLQDRL